MTYDVCFSEGFSEGFLGGLLEDSAGSAGLSVFMTRPLALSLSSLVSKNQLVVQLSGQKPASTH